MRETRSVESGTTSCRVLLTQIGEEVVGIEAQDEVAPVEVTRSELSLQAGAWRRAPLGEDVVDVLALTVVGTKSVGLVVELADA
jgi:hypothetical protein